MKPCDCKDMTDTKKLNETGLFFNGIGVSISPSMITITTGTCAVNLPMHVFKRFAEWYLEDQNY